MMMSTCPNCVAQVRHEDHLREIKCAVCGHVFPTVLDDIPDDEPEVPTAQGKADLAANAPAETEQASENDGPAPELSDALFAENTAMTPEPVTAAEMESSAAAEPESEPESEPEPDPEPEPEPVVEEAAPFAAADPEEEDPFGMPDLSPPTAEESMGEEGLPDFSGEASAPDDVPDFGIPEPDFSSPEEAALPDLTSDDGGDDGLPDFSSDEGALPEFDPPSPAQDEDASPPPNPFGEFHSDPPSPGESGPDFGMESEPIPDDSALNPTPEETAPAPPPSPTPAETEPQLGDFDAAPSLSEPPLESTAPFSESSTAFAEIRQFGENLGTTPEAPAEKKSPAPTPGQSQPAPDVANLPLTSGDTLTGYTLEEYLSPVSATCAFADGDNPLRTAFDALLAQATKQGANGVVAVRWTVMDGGKKVLVSGTAVKCTKKK